jgi:hypothetical protein
MIELYVPDGEGYDLELVRIGRGYRDLFRRDPYTKSGSCNINVICPLATTGDQIRAVAVRHQRPTFCAGTLVSNIRQTRSRSSDRQPLRDHLSTPPRWSSTELPVSAAAVAAALNQSTRGRPTGPRTPATSPARARASQASAYNVYAGFDARTTTAPRAASASTTNTDERRSPNDDR